MALTRVTPAVMDVALAAVPDQVMISADDGSLVGIDQANLHIAGANVSGAVANAAHANSATVASTANSVAGANVTGAVAYATTANAVAGANVSGTVANATYATTAGTANAVAGANVSGTVANATYALSAGSANVAGTANSVAAANITGTITFATNSTNANVANSVAGTNVTGTVANATYATSAGTANSVAGSNVSGAVANATYATTAGTANSVAGANVSGTVAAANTAATVTTNAQPNITSVGTLTSLSTTGDILVGGNLTINGTLTTVHSTEVALDDKNLTLANSATNAAQANGGGITINGANATITYKSSDDTWNFNKQIVGNLTGTASSATVANSANSVAGANVTGTVANATYATSAGSATVAGTANAVAAANITGTVSFATNSTTANTANSVAGANVTGTVANATYATTAGTANAVAGANVTGTVANATYAVTAGTANSVAAANITGTVSFATNSTNANVANSVAGANVSGTVANATYATSAGTAGTANSVAAANITGTVAFATASTNANVAFSVAGANVTGTVANATYAVTAGTANAVAGANVTGTVANATYAVTAGTANAVAGGNVSGTVANATYAVTAGTANAVALANVSGAGNIASINLNGNGSTALLGNGTWGTVSSYGDANVANYLPNYSGNINFTGANISLGNVSNLRITGGSNGQVLSTNGSGTLTWATVSGGGSASIGVWSSSNSYSSGTVVSYNGDLYQANDTVAANTAFTVGTTGATWTTLSRGSLTAEFGESVLGNGANASISSITTTQSTANTVVSFTLPSAGTWEVQSVVRGYQDGAVTNNGINFGIFDASNNLVANSEGKVLYWNSSGSLFTITGTQVSRITTTGSATYTLKAWRDGSQGGPVILSDTNGRTKVTWSKISGFLPAVGSTASYGYYTGTAPGYTSGAAQDMTLALGAGNLPLDATNKFIQLKAGVTYELTAGFLARATWLNYQWFTEGGTAIGTVGTSASANSSDTTCPAPSYALYTPTSDVRVKVRITNSAGFTAIDAAFSGQISVVQVGTTNTAAFTGMLSNSWNINNTYPAGAIVMYQSQLYQANNTIPADTAFVVGTGTNQWTGIGNVAASYARYVRTTQQTTGLTANSRVICDVAETTYGSDITVNTSTGQITLKAGRTYRLVGGVPTVQSSTTNSRPGFRWYNETTAAYIGNSSNQYQANDSSGNIGAGGPAQAIITPTVDTIVSYRIHSVNPSQAISALGGVTDFTVGGTYPWFEVEVIAGFTPLAPKSFTEAITIGATTTAPTKGATRVQDYINLVDDNSGWCQVSMMYRHTSAGGAGTGDYLYTLPAGYTFDSTYHPGYTVVGQNAAAGPGLESHIPGGRGEINNTNVGTYFLVVVYDATRFRLLQESTTSWWGDVSAGVRRPQSATYFNLNETTITFNAGFRFKKG